MSCLNGYNYVHTNVCEALCTYNYVYCVCFTHHSTLYTFDLVSLLYVHKAKLITFNNEIFGSVLKIKTKISSCGSKKVEPASKYK